MTTARVTFQEELSHLEESLEVESQLVLRSIRGATEALVSQDVELASEVIAFDDDIDQSCFDIQHQIELLLARQTPVATDLRLVLAILYSNLHLERMGDQCTTIAKLTQLAEGLSADPVLLEGFREMGDRAEEMLRIALDSFAARDVERARSLPALDDLIDATNRRVAQKVLDMAHTPGTQEWGLRMIVVARCLERVGDNAVDIGEQTAFVVTGEFQELKSPSL